VVQLYHLVYVDDIILTSTHPHVHSTLIAKLQGEFPLKDLGPLHFFLGIQVTRSSHGIHLCQTKYITELLHKTNISPHVPLAPNFLGMLVAPCLIPLCIDKLWEHFNTAPSLG